MAIHETTVTELLNSFFNNEPKYLRKSIVNFLIKNTENVSFDNLNTFNDQGKFRGNSTYKAPDIVFEGDNSLIFIEVKINNDPLEDSQKCKDENNKDCYIGMLHDVKKNKIYEYTDLYFLVPDYYGDRKNIPVDDKHIITWKELNNFVKENEYDNQILNRILHLVNNAEQTQDIATEQEMNMAPMFLKNSILWINRISSRLRAIIDSSEVKKIISKDEKPTPYSWRSVSGSFNKLSYESIYEGLGNNKWISLDIYDSLPYLYIHSTYELNGDNISNQFNDNDNYIYNVGKINDSINLVIENINRLCEINKK